MKLQLLLIMILLPLVASKTSNWYKWKKKRDNFTEKEVYDAYRKQFINDGTKLVRRELCYIAYYRGISLTIRTKNPDSDAESMDCGNTGGWTHRTIYKPSIGSHGDYKRVIGGEKQKTEGGGYSGLHAMANFKSEGTYREDVARVKNNYPTSIWPGDDWDKIYESIRNDSTNSTTLNKFLTRTRNKLMFDKYTSGGDQEDSDDSDDVPRRRRHHNNAAAACGVLFLWSMFIILFF